MNASGQSLRAWSGVRLARPSPSRAAGTEQARVFEGWRWLVSQWTVAEVVVLALLLVYLLPFLPVLGRGVTDAGRFLRWPILGFSFLVLAVFPSRRGTLTKPPLPAKLLIPWVAAAGFSSIASPTLQVSLMKFTVFAITLLLVYRFLLRGLDMMRWCRMQAVLAIILAGLTLPSVVAGESIAEDYYRTAGFIEAGPNAVGVIGTMALGLVLPFIVYHFARRHWWKTLALVFAALGIVFVLFATGSRSSVAAALGGVLIWLATFRARSSRQLVSVILGIVVGGLLLALSPFIQEQGRYLFRERGFSLDTFESRREVWSASLESWSERPFLGFGYGSSGLGRDVSGLAYQAFTIRDASGYFGLLESLGAVGLVLFGCYLLSMIGCYRRLSALPPESLPRAGGLSALVCHGALAVNHFGEPWLLGPGSVIFLVFWLTGAAALAVAYNPVTPVLPRRSGSLPVLPMREKQRLSRAHDLPE
ncbi:O-antigen ligase family protein [Candidatus Poribacteria bacterium]|nr:O-antigen ligase family protein [Candidatus Poribacteria bacterium]